MSTSASRGWCRRCSRDPSGWPNWAAWAAGDHPQPKRLQPEGMDEKAVAHVAEPQPARVPRTEYTLASLVQHESPALSISSTGAPARVKWALAGDFGRFALRVLWQCVRVPVFLLLVTLEPIVTFVLGAFALLGILTALFWEFFGPPHFHFFLVGGVSLGLALGRVLYQKLVCWLAI